MTQSNWSFHYHSDDRFGLDPASFHPATQSKFALELQEYEIARERVLIGTNDPQTRTQAETLLKKLEKRRRKGRT